MMAKAIKCYGVHLNEDFLQDEADEMELSLDELKKRLNAAMEKIEPPEAE